MENDGLPVFPVEGSITIIKDNSYYLERQEQNESNARSYPRRIPIAMKSARGSWVEDVEGNRYLDCLSGAGTIALGHNHPRIIETMKAVLESGLPLHTLDFATPVRDRFTEMIMERLPKKLQSRSRIQFCGPSGSDAVDAAIKLCKIATGRSTVISFHGAYHGMGHGPLSLTGNLNAKTPVGNLMPGVQFFPYPYSYRCPFGLGGEAGTRAASHYFERVLNDVESGIPKPAAVILEAVQGEGGVIPGPLEWLQTVRRVTAELDIPLIVDEIQAGIGRTGEFFAFEHAGIVPDVIVVSKAIGGSLPLAVLLYDEKLDTWKPGAHAGTFRGNQIAMAAGITALEVISEDKLIDRAARIGKGISDRLKQLKSETNIIGDVRGVGLMLGVEFIDPKSPPDHLGAKKGSGEIAAAVQKGCLERGLIIESGGRRGAVLRFLPSMIISEDDVDLMLKVFRESVFAAELQYER